MFAIWFNFFKKLSCKCERGRVSSFCLLWKVFLFLIFCMILGGMFVTRILFDIFIWVSDRRCFLPYAQG